MPASRHRRCYVGSVPPGKDVEACAVCGRTILRGERIAEYVAPEGARAGVCALCKQAAEAAGWVPAELAGTLERDTGTRRRGLGLRERLSRATAAARELAARPRQGAEEAAGTGEEPARGPAPPAPKGPRRQPARAAREGTVRRGRDRGDRRATEDPPPQTPPPLTPERLLRHGVEQFNASSEPRKVAGLIRTLGAPRVAVRPNRASSVVVTVAWELSWYQWEVSAEPNGDPVRVAGKGREISELASRDRSWNAAAAGDGRLRLELAAARTSAEDE
jgi:hypothetical protein